MKTEEKQKLLYDLEDKMGETFEKISDFIFRHPELGGDEVQCSKFLVELMQNEGFDVVHPYGREKTAFRAEKKNGIGPTIALLAEYDALPGYSDDGAPAHACGHNWIAAVSAGTAIVLNRIMEHINGRVVLIGTPAEETYGAKIGMLDDNCFEDIDIAMEAHLEKHTNIMASALAMNSLQFTFLGKAAHAAQFPYDGINALDAVQLTFAGINALRQQLRDDVRIHGIITNGGNAINIIPDKAECAFYVRGIKKGYVDQITERVINCAEGAALMTGAEMQMSIPEPAFEDIVSIPVLVNLASHNMQRHGIIQECGNSPEPPGSTDIGNVSHRIPTLYTEVALDEKCNFKVHDKSALQYANSPDAYNRMHQMIKSFAGIAIHLFDNPEVIDQAKQQLKEATENCI